MRLRFAHFLRPGPTDNHPADRDLRNYLVRRRTLLPNRRMREQHLRDRMQRSGRPVHQYRSNCTNPANDGALKCCSPVPSGSGFTADGADYVDMYLVKNYSGAIDFGESKPDDDLV